MNREEIIERFEKYDFRDQNGHPLANCLDFHMLIDQAISDNESVRSLERYLCERSKHATHHEN
ncbi:MAG: hypothetical protein PHV05_04835 [Candidatus Riflebacteria bacterium]|nr:hypothetical protein [Candidatus Riflebacteria bacterium]